MIQCYQKYVSQVCICCSIPSIYSGFVHIENGSVSNGGLSWILTIRALVSH